MSGLVTRFAYDQTGTNADNLITNEPHVLSSKQVRAFAPIYGPFYADNAKIYDAATNTLLERGTQYQFVELLKELSLKVGKEIFCVVLILDQNVSSNVTITYNCVGGLYQNQSAEAIVNLYETVAADTRPVAWKDILNKPLQFDPTDHAHLLTDINGFEPVVTILERIRNALMLSDVPIYEAMVDYFNQLVATLQTDVANNNAAVAAILAQMTSLQAALNAEIIARGDSDNALQLEINSLLSQLQTEITNRTNADTQLRSDLNAEISARTSADATLTTNLNAEITARTNADTTLSNNLAAEVTARTNAITAEVTARTTAISNEATARAAGDATLQAEIDNLGTTLATSYLRLDGSNNMSGPLRSTRVWDGTEAAFSQPQAGFVKWGATKSANTANDLIFGSNGSGIFAWYRHNGTTWVQNATLDASGNFIATGDLGAYSDERLKTDWKRITGALDKIEAIEGGTFRRKATGEVSVGVIAQAVRAVLPEAVKVDSEGYLSVAYANMVGLLIEGIKELRAVVKDQQAQIDALKTKA